MTSFDDRQKAFEQKYKIDQELDFKVTARRNKLLGLWLAKQFGLNDSNAEQYAKSVVMADFEKPGDDDVVEKVMHDCRERRVSISEHLIRKQMQEFKMLAKQQRLQEQNKS